MKNNMLYLLFLSILYNLQHYHKYINVQATNVLSEFSLEQLLYFKKSFPVADTCQSIPHKKNDITNNKPQALALQMREIKDDSKSYYYLEDGKSGQKDKSITQSIFQISVTSLAFLALGSYLLCLVIHATRVKNGNQQTPALQEMLSYINNSIKRKQIQKIVKKTTPKNKYLNTNIRKQPRAKRNVINFDTDQNLYSTLILFSEIYTHAQPKIMNFRNFNVTELNLTP